MNVLEVKEFNELERGHWTTYFRNHRFKVKVFSGFESVIVVNPESRTMHVSRSKLFEPPNEYWSWVFSIYLYIFYLLMIQELRNGFYAKYFLWTQIQSTNYLNIYLVYLSIIVYKYIICLSVYQCLLVNNLSICLSLFTSKICLSVYHCLPVNSLSVCLSLSTSNLFVCLSIIV